MFAGAKQPLETALIEVEIESLGYAGALTVQTVADILWGKDITWRILKMFALSRVSNTHFWLQLLHSHRPIRDWLWHKHILKIPSCCLTAQAPLSKENSLSSHAGSYCMQECLCALPSCMCLSMLPDRAIPMKSLDCYLEGWNFTHFIIYFTLSRASPSLTRWNVLPAVTAH